MRDLVRRQRVGGARVRPAAGERGQDDRGDHPRASASATSTRISLRRTAMRAVTRSNPDADAASDELAGESSRSRDEKKALQRKHILEAARDVFFRDGFVHANLDEVAQRAGVAKGTLYRYFENKGELYVAVLVAQRRDLRAAHARRRGLGEEPAEQIRRARSLLLRALDLAPRVLPDLLGPREPGGDRRAPAGGRRRGHEALGGVPAHPRRRGARRHPARRASVPATSG